MGAALAVFMFSFTFTFMFRRDSFTTKNTECGTTRVRIFNLAADFDTKNNGKPPTTTLPFLVEGTSETSKRYTVASSSKFYRLAGVKLPLYFRHTRFVQRHSQV